MPCFHPWNGYFPLSGEGKPKSKWSEGYDDVPKKLPCGQCIGCRLQHSLNWAVRCVHEASLYRRNCFLTLTYNNEHLPRDNTLVLRHVQLFFKKLRKKFGSGIRYFLCGEYGDNFARPHYHACLFNFDFRDKKVWKETVGGRLYVSEELNKLWGYGYCIIGDVTFESAAYVARYVTKKITGKRAVEHYNVVDRKTGEILKERIPEFVVMSRRPGIARNWFMKYSSDVFPKDFVTVRGKKVRPARYYDRLFDIKNPEMMAFIKKERERKQKLCENDNTPQRLLVKEQVQTARSTLFQRRSYEK